MFSSKNITHFFALGLVLLSMLPTTAYAQVTDRFKEFIATRMSDEVSNATRNVFANAMYQENVDTKIAIFKGAALEVQIKGANYAVNKLYDEGYWSVENAKELAALANEHAPLEVSTILAGLPERIRKFEAYPQFDWLKRENLYASNPGTEYAYEEFAETATLADLKTVCGHPDASLENRAAVARVMKKRFGSYHNCKSAVETLKNWGYWRE